MALDEKKSGSVRLMYDITLREGNASRNGSRLLTWVSGVKLYANLNNAQVAGSLTFKGQSHWLRMKKKCIEGPGI